MESTGKERTDMEDTPQSNGKGAAKRDGSFRVADLPDEHAIEFLGRMHGLDEGDARLYLAMMRGEATGDVVFGVPEDMEEPDEE